VEVLIALMVVSLVILGLVKATTASVKNVGYAKDQNQAVAMAQKKIAEVIETRNQSANFFTPLPSFPDSISADGKFCLKTVVTNVSGELPTTTPDFVNARMAKISVDVFWDDVGGGTDCGSRKYFFKQHFETNVTN